MKKAFTLAEVLLVIGIIGVVATLTVPQIKDTTMDREAISGLQKTFANLQNAMKLAKDKYGEDIAAWTKNDNFTEEQDPTGNLSIAAQGQRIGSRLAEYLQVDATCGLNANEACFSSSPVSTASGNSIKIQGEEGTESNYSLDQDTSLYKILLKDKVAIGFKGTNTILIDSDGPKNGFNTVGKDIYEVTINEDGDITYLPAHLMTSTEVASCLTGNALNCASWVLNFGNTDYTRCSGLSNTKTTCK